MELPPTIPVWMADVQTERFIEASDAALRLFGYTREEFLELRPHNIVIEAEHRALEARRQPARERWGEGSEWTCVRRDGSRFTMRVRFHLTFLNGRQVYMVFANDVRDLGTIAS
jgi:PAS domain S-box-containing protein